jgi:hypothetical protein
MKTAALALLAMIAATPAFAQQERPDGPTLDHPSARNRLSEQLGEVGARIDHRLGEGRLSADYADQARRKVNDLQAEISDGQIRNGGQLTEGDRFAIQEQIHQLVEEIDRNSGPAPPR